MKIVGLTGGIGSGKSTVAAMFKELGVAVYIADVEAKRLMTSSKIIRRKLTLLLGDQAYNKDGLNRSFIANKIFNDTSLLETVNAIVHPKVASHFKRWIKKQKGNYCIKEVAILFENGGHKQCDLTILVTSPEEVRINRVMERDKSTRKEVLDRIKNQWTDAEKAELADIIIENVILESTAKRVLEIHKELQK
ncbi:dephospho-CoA kinase [Ulvibacter antarcticus]|uniref:Dephospho-CoA kinase n=1 Tax=Ulvibacter antarcticus TaxID=442714 RepID=A0A3L9YW44_9FLAO|nr:dephospho-CoA kinase [Ulvibacter antarcticus]RMA64896.1 dephospho-CoA kinase [Ulvibacter antarcticus]